MKMIERVGRKIAVKSNHAWAKHACILTKGGNIVSAASNQDEGHAEAIALYRLPNRSAIGGRIDARGVVAWSMRFNVGGSFGNARPCGHCEEMLRACGVRTVVYSTPAGWVKLRLRVKEEQ